MINPFTPLTPREGAEYKYSCPGSEWSPVSCSERHMPRIDEMRAELAAVLSSKHFSRAPTLVQFLSYVCEKYFQGQADQIKEYTVAVEAFGRPDTFEPKRDPIVRVDANRLRLRLLKYYRYEGRSHPIKISLPSGQYVPVFQFVHEATAKRGDSSGCPSGDQPTGNERVWTDTRQGPRAGFQSGPPAGKRRFPQADPYSRLFARRPDAGHSGSLRY